MVSNNFKVRWKFKNDSMWEKSFDSPELRDSFINSVGLVSHPDIVRVTLLYPDSSIKDIVIKDVNFSSPDRLMYDNMSGNQDITSISSSPYLVSVCLDYSEFEITSIYASYK
jgi:hypothetical protein